MSFEKMSFSWIPGLLIDLVFFSISTIRDIRGKFLIKIRVHLRLSAVPACFSATSAFPRFTESPGSTECVPPDSLRR